MTVAAPEKRRVAAFDLLERLGVIVVETSTWSSTCARVVCVVEPALPSAPHVMVQIRIGGGDFGCWHESKTPLRNAAHFFCAARE